MVHVRQRQGMPERPGQGWSRGRIAAVAAGAIALLLAVGTGRAINRNRQVRAELVELQQRIQRYRAENQELAQNLDYLSSDAFVAAEARRSLGLGLPGEQPVVVVPQSEAAASLAAGQQQSSPSLASLWWRYFFGDNVR
jgi:cell division protein FtsB